MAAPPNVDAHAGGDLSETELVELLRSGDEGAFQTLVERYHRSLIRVAMTRVPDSAIAEEIAQETWLALVRGIDRFEGRSSLKTWLFRVVIYQAMRLARHADPAIPLYADESIDRDRFLPNDHRWAGHWAEPPTAWESVPESTVLADETLAQIERLIESLPPRQRAVIVLRDIEGLPAADVCQVMQISDAIERVLLHRARTRVRAGLATYLTQE